jgi:hypothetical protein
MVRLLIKYSGHCSYGYTSATVSFTIFKAKIYFLYADLIKRTGPMGNYYSFFLL